jgi:hypothetical protein
MLFAVAWFLAGALAALVGVLCLGYWQYRKAKGSQPNVLSSPEHRWERSGPYRAKPEVDVEFLDKDGQAIGSVTAELVVKVASSGLLITTTHYVDFLHTGPREVVIHAWQIWVGNESLTAPIPPVKLGPTDTYRLKNLNIPIRLTNDIWFGPGDGGDDDPQPTPPLPSGHKEKVR